MSESEVITTIGQILPWATGAGAPVVAWLVKKAFDIDRQLQKLSAVEARLDRHDADADALKDRVSHIEIAVARLEVKIDLILEKLNRE